MVTEHTLEGERFYGVVFRGAGAVSVDDIHLVRTQLRVAESALHGLHGAASLRVRLADSVSIEGISVAANLSEDFHAATPSRVERLQYEHGRAFAKDETVASAIEWARGGGRLI